MLTGHFDEDGPPEELEAMIATLEGSLSIVEDTLLENTAFRLEGSTLHLGPSAYVSFCQELDRLRSVS